MKARSIILSFALSLLVLSLFPTGVLAQFSLDGDFRVRWYTDSFQEARDCRSKENYGRYLARLRGKTNFGRNSNFTVELISLIDNPGQPVRNIMGTGAMRLGVSQIYAEMSEPDFLIFDVARLRVGRQQFPIGNGLSWGESYYMLDKFDGARVDLLYDPVTLSLFGAITGQNLSPSGLYPDPGSDQIYAARLGTTLFNQDLMAYVIQQLPRGDFNDNIVYGIGSTGQIVFKDLEYFVEGAYQISHQPPGFPKKHGLGGMFGIGYRWGMGPFRSIKVETRYAAYEGDDPATADIEQFSPPYPSFYWGSRTGYVDGEVGGDYPNHGKNPAGSQMWYTRIYFIPRDLPKIRVQFQYTAVGQYIGNNLSDPGPFRIFGHNVMDDEASARIYYAVSGQSQFQLRYSRVIPNDVDKDWSGDGTISSTEDRVFVNSWMVEWQIKF